MRAFLLLLATAVPLLAQVSYVPSLLGTWEPRNLVTKSGLVASYDPGNTAANVSNPTGWAVGSAIVALSNRVTTGTADLLQGTALNQPIVAGTLAGRKVASFDGIAQYLQTPAFTWIQPAEIFLLVNLLTWTDTDRIYSGNVDDTIVLNQRTSTPNIRMYAGTAGTIYSPGTLGTWVVLRNAWTGLNSYHSVDGSAPVVENTGAQNPGGFTLAAAPSKTNFCNMLFARGFLCSKTNAPAEANFIQWGLLKSKGGTFFTILSPQPYQVFQQTAGVSDIPITGYLDGTHDIEARFNGGAWTLIASACTVTFSGTLSAQAAGQGLLEVRFADAPTTITSAAYVGVGDVFVIAGQSNAVGNGNNNQSYSTAGVKASLFGFDYNWKNLTDPTHSDSGQVDAVNDNGTAAKGSIWPLVATRFLTNQVFPVAFIPCALTGSGVDQWQRDAVYTNRTTLYGSMLWRTKYVVGGCKGVLWWQGEHEAGFSRSQSYYYDYFTNFTAEVYSDLGVKVMPCKFQNCSGIPDGQEAPILAAIAQAWASDPNTVTGPDLSDLPSDDAYHLQTDAHLATAAERWWNSIMAAWYP